MIFYLCWAAASATWSSDAAMTCRKLAVLGFCVLAALGLARQFRPRDLAAMAMTLTGAYLAIGLATELALGTFRPWSSEYRFAGTVHPNTQGAFLTIFCLSAFNLAREKGRRQVLLWALFAVGCMFLLLTKSRTSCGGLLAALGALWLLRASGRQRLSAAAAAAAVVSALALAGAMFDDGLDERLAQAVMLGRGEDAETLTGRLPIWTELLAYISRRPLAGYGYESFWTARRVETISEDLQWPLREAHNAYIDCTLGVGLIGAAALLAAALGATGRAARVYRATSDAGAATVFCLLVFALVNAGLESGMAAPSFLTLLIGGGAAATAFGKHCERGAARPTGYNPWAWGNMKSDLT
jgi:O-antigen ligase